MFKRVVTGIGAFLLISAPFSSAQAALLAKVEADVDGSGGIDITDATLIQWWLAEMETPYPIGTQFEIPTVTTAAPTERQTDADGWGRDVFRP